MKKFEVYPVLINGVPYNLVVRSSFTVFTANGIFTTIPNTVTISIANQGTLASVVTVNGAFNIAVGTPDLILGGDAYMRRDDRFNITFAGAGVNRCVITMDVVKGIVPLEFI